MTSIAPTLDEYATKYEHVRLERDDGILQVTLHSGGDSLVWRCRRFPGGMARVSWASWTC